MARSRSASAHKKVLRAVLELVADRGIDATSMDAVAAKSGVSKATIYKHWADKDALLLEMMLEAHGLRERPNFDTGRTRSDMADVLSYRPPEDGGLRERIMPHLVAYSATRKEFGMAWRNMAMDPPRKELTLLIKKGISKGELDAKVNLELALAVLLGPALYGQIFLKRTDREVLPRPLAEFVVDVFWARFGLKKKPMIPLIPQKLHVHAQADR